MTRPLPMPQILPYADPIDPAIRGQAVAGYGHIRLSELPWALTEGESQGAVECVKSSSTRRVLSFEENVEASNPVRLYAKRNRSRNWRKGLMYRLVSSKAKREWAIGWALLTRAFITGRPVIWAERVERGLVTQNYLVTEAIRADAMLFDHLRDLDSPDEKSAVMRAVAEYLRVLHGVCFYHDDLSAEHVWIRRGERPEFGLIDLDQSRFALRRSRGREMSNFHQLLRSIPPETLSPEGREAFLAAYHGDAWSAVRAQVIRGLEQIQERKGSQRVMG